MLICTSTECIIVLTSCPLGWVNKYQIFEIEKKQCVVKLFYQKIMKKIFFIIFLHKCIANLRLFANNCKLPVAHTF